MPFNDSEQSSKSEQSDKPEQHSGQKRSKLSWLGQKESPYSFCWLAVAKRRVDRAIAQSCGQFYPGIYPPQVAPDEIKPDQSQTKSRFFKRIRE